MDPDISFHEAKRLISTLGYAINMVFHYRSSEMVTPSILQMNFCPAREKVLGLKWVFLKASNMKDLTFRGI